VRRRAANHRAQAQHGVEAATICTAPGERRNLEGAGAAHDGDTGRAASRAAKHVERLIEEDGISGVTSNPSIFEKAFGDSDRYDDDIHSLAEQGKDWDAFFAAGYDYDDAVQLAKIWKSKADIGTIKAQAGAMLLAGQTLPVTPDPANVATGKENAEVDAFFNAGYTTEDAVTLAGIWKTKDVYSAKIEGGVKVLAGEKLPIAPDPANVQSAKEATEVKKTRIDQTKDAAGNPETFPDGKPYGYGIQEGFEAKTVGDTTEITMRVHLKPGQGVTPEITKKLK